VSRRVAVADGILTTSQLDIYRTASLLLKQYGDEALSIATKRANALADQDDIEGAAVWLSVIRAIKELKSITPEGPTH
jgi:hypothetical protein